MGKVVHPCRVLFFSKSRVHGYGRLGNGRVIIENMNIIVKLSNLSVCRIDFLGVIEGVILDDRFS